MLENITIEKLQEIEDLRSRTMADTNFQRWMKEMKIGIMASNKHNCRARDMMRLWQEDSGRIKGFDLVVSKLRY